MSREIVASPTLFTVRPGESFNVLANMSRRVYPLNLQTQTLKREESRKKSVANVPEFIREFIKDVPLPKRPNSSIRSSKGHKRSHSLNYSNGSPLPQNRVETANPRAIPALSYKDFKFRHQNSRCEDRLYTPQVVEITKRSKIILHSSKPITINPSLYEGKKSKRSATTEKKSSICGSTIVPQIGPGITYGEKILRLKSLVSSNFLL